MDLRNQRALVTGASSGLGIDFARMLAADGAALVLTARREDRLEALAAELRTAHGVEVDVLPLDLGAPGSPRALFDATEGAGKAVDVLVNNAGFGTHGRFLSIPWDTTAQQLQVNVVALTALTHLFVRPMVKRRRGHILHVASLASYQPVPFYGTYAATKAYVRHFSEALSEELKASGVRVCCLDPGPTDTEFVDVAGHALPAWQRLFLMPPARCAQLGLDALFAGRRNVVAGWLNLFTAWLVPRAPRRIVVWITGLVMQSEP